MRTKPHIRRIIHSLVCAAALATTLDSDLSMSGLFLGVHVHV